MTDPVPDPVTVEPGRDQTPVPPAAKPPLRKKGDGFFKRLFMIVVLLGLVATMGTFGAIVRPGPVTAPTTVIVPHGANTRTIADLLEAQGVIRHALFFRIAAKIISYDSLRAGEYQFVPGQSIAETVLMMHEGRSVVHKFTVAEGLTSVEIVRLLKDSAALSGDITVEPKEGSMLPETYLYSYGDTRAGLIGRMQKNMQTTLADLWAKRDPAGIAASPEEAVIMASVVEKETGKPNERARIAGVFYNRIRQKMRLQSDPTVIYAIAKASGFMDHDIDHADLTFVSPYNTYLNDGLPPGPICNPGRASLEAVLHPETNDYLFFVADGTGGHVFARSLAEHNQNVARWNALRQRSPQ